MGGGNFFCDSQPQSVMSLFGGRRTLVKTFKNPLPFLAWNAAATILYADGNSVFECKCCFYFFPRFQSLIPFSGFGNTVRKKKKDTASRRCMGKGIVE